MPEAMLRGMLVVVLIAFGFALVWAFFKLLQD